MDIATVAGIAICVVLILATIFMGGNPVMFMNIPSVLTVVGGTIGATLIRNPLAMVLGTVGVVTKAFMTKVPPPETLIPQIIELCKKARKEGMLALETVPVEYEFLQKGVGLCVDGVELDQIRSILDSDVRATAARHRRGAEILEGMGQAAPAFGMIGTLIGLVQMLATLDDPSSIGPAMAVALLTTLYGALLANVICLPLADKLRIRSAEEMLGMAICLEGTLGLSQGDNPNAVDQKLKSFIAPKLRDIEEEAA